MKKVDLTYKPYPNRQDWGIFCEEHFIGKIEKGIEIYFN